MLNENIKGESKTKINLSNIEEYRVPTCAVCDGQLKDFYTRVRTCTLCGAKRSSQHKAQIKNLLGQRSMAYFMLATDFLGGYDNLMEIVASFGDDGVLLQRKGVTAGSLPSAFCWVKKEIGREMFEKESAMLGYHKVGIPTPRPEFYDALRKFYSTERRIIKYSQSTTFIGNKKAKIEKMIKSYLHLFMSMYGADYKRIDFGEARDNSFDIIEEPLTYGITGEIFDAIKIDGDTKVSEVLPILKFCAEKKLSTTVASPFTRKLHIIYDLPLEHLCDDLSYETQPSD